MERSHWKLELFRGQRTLVTVVVLSMTLDLRLQIALVIGDENDFCPIVNAWFDTSKIAPWNGN